MIQRVQTIYLALVFILVAIMLFLPVVVFHAGDVVFYMTIFRFEGIESLDFIDKLPNIWPLPIFAGFLGIISLVSIFRYNNRKQQMFINMIALMFNFALLAGIFLFADNVAALEGVEDKVIYDIAAYFPVITVLMLILANRNIRKDEKLVRSADRLR
jgi:peptidoglycan/LPS O-acetylase OafA/YrhL